tara:strand:- start:18 stop:209 length:192 start_codon:yes stop_codon:yes gene_type:complete
MATSKPMTKAEALKNFREMYKTLPTALRGDAIAKREDWNNYTDALCKNGRITLNQYENWDQPF